jgi:CBS domain-containing protein
MATVREVLRTKGSQVFTIDRGETVFRAIEEMTRNNAGALIVTDGGFVCGIVTERDYLRKIALEGRSSRTTRVEEILSAPVVCADPDDSVESCLATMVEKRFRHLPVRGDGEFGLGGIVSIGDCVKHIVQDQKQEIRLLQDYIQGNYH